MRVRSSSAVDALDSCTPSSMCVVLPSLVSVLLSVADPSSSPNPLQLHCFILRPDGYPGRYALATSLSVGSTVPTSIPRCRSEAGSQWRLHPVYARQLDFETPNGIGGGSQ